MPRRAKVDSMPSAVRAWLDHVLANREHAGYMQLAATLRDKGFEISHAALHRYDVKVQRSLAAIRASTEAARLIADAAPDDTDQRSAAVISLVQSQLFDAMLKLQEAEEETDQGERLKLLSAAARSIADVSRSSMGQKRFADEIRRKAAQAAADAATTAGGRRGLTEEAIAEIRREILGMN